MNNEVKAYIWGALGIIGFGLTLPATKVAIPLFGVVAVGVGRAVISGVLGLLLLWITKSKIPTIKQIQRLRVVALGVVFGFPLFSAYAMNDVPAFHGAIVIGLLPLFTALFAVILAKEKPSVRFWIAAVVGSATIVIYSIYVGGGSLHTADVALLFAVISAALGYAEGTKLAKELGSWRVICYALVLSLPISIPLFCFSVQINSQYNVISAWVGFVYVSVVSMLLAFFAWYRGLELGGIAKIGQLQLFQPFITIFASAVLFSEQLSSDMFLVLAIVLASVYLDKRSRVLKT
ncbi:EamA/RhaT family transporter [Phormidesmis priestleyi ULC007]|uniref:EamA/RhaT family transporter n=1 Tax=Phormidesmis priestleyi ULC007 TaxID=1920490 RepID=A0A2T1DDS8_9CYAN|nr:DMT family transporter [Phormidesmis priestleyi]PSB18672.1 EamA/RhaT family transporter [Phormidesmis priestleyi ULC007]PZO51567.1 MAG: EamA/RhaT family transporter [Phormidesmis priestleyi]